MLGVFVYSYPMETTVATMSGKLPAFLLNAAATTIDMLILYTVQISSLHRVGQLKKAKSQQYYLREKVMEICFTDLHNLFLLNANQ